MNKISPGLDIGKTLKQQRVQVLLDKIQKQINLEFHEDALKNLQELLNYRTKSMKPEIAFQIADCLYQLHKYKTCLSLLESIVTDEHRKLPMIQNLKGQCYIRMGNLDKAIDHFEMCLVIDPKFKVANNNLGNIYLQQKDYSKSKIYFEKSKKRKL